MPASDVEAPPLRDPRIEDPTNLWLIHPAARSLLSRALKLGISANAVSVTGMILGVLAAVAYFRWADWRFATAGFLLCIGWLIADGLDGMVARARGTASAFGRVIDGLCDHAVFGCVYISFALSKGTVEAWALGWAAAAAHAVQSSLYEGERARFHRRLRGDAAPVAFPQSNNPLSRAYNMVANSMDRAAAPFDLHMAASPSRFDLIALYRARATAPMKLQALLASNTRVFAIYVFCLVGDPMLFWWFEITCLSAVAFLGILWHRRVERLLLTDGKAKAAA